MGIFFDEMGKNSKGREQKAKTILFIFLIN